VKLAIIVPHFNPCGYARQTKNLVRFTNSIIPQCGGIYLAWAKFDDVFTPAEFIGGVTRNATPLNLMWQKESLVNIAIRALLDDYDAIAWIDADLLFCNPTWHYDTCLALEHFPVVQMFEKIIYFGPNGAPQSVAYGTASGPYRLTFNAPGGAIACRRELLTNGIYDRHPLGGGDEIFMDACLGRQPRFFKDINASFREHISRWCESFGQHPVGFISGVVKHLWHGDREGRQYTSRHQLLGSYNFDPAVDVRIGENGLLEWASDKPALHAAVREYFVNRNEDDDGTAPQH